MTDPLNERPGIDILSREQSVYFNGFAIAISPGDFVITLTYNGVATTTLNASFTVTKTFAINLARAIEKLESKMKSPIVTVDEFQNLLHSETAEDAPEKNS